MRQPSQARVRALQGGRKGIVSIVSGHPVRITHRNHEVTATAEINSGTSVRAAGSG